MQDDYLTRCVVDPVKRKFYLYSEQGDEKIVDCETVDQFMSVLELCRAVLGEEAAQLVLLHLGVAAHVDLAGVRAVAVALLVGHGFFLLGLLAAKAGISAASRLGADLAAGRLAAGLSLIRCWARVERIATSVCGSSDFVFRAPNSSMCIP